MVPVDVESVANIIYLMQGVERTSPLNRIPGPERFIHEQAVGATAPVSGADAFRLRGTEFG